MHSFDQMTLKIDNINQLFEENVIFLIFLKKITSIEMKMYLYTPSSMYHLAIWIPNKCMKKSIFSGIFRELPGSREFRNYFRIDRGIKRPEK